MGRRKACETFRAAAAGKGETFPMPPVLTLAPGEAIPGPWGLVEALLVLTFAAHILVVNVALGGTLLTLFAPGAGRETAMGLAKRLPATVAVGVNLAVPPLLFASVLYGQYLYTAAIVSAVPWLSLFMVVMVAYALLYVYQPRAGAPGAGLLPAAAALLLLAASLILVNVSVLTVRPDLWTQYFTAPAGLATGLADPTFLPRWFHFLAASLAVGGLYVALFSRKAPKAPDAGAAGRSRTGLSWFIGATLAQIPIGLWYLLSLPTPVMERFFGLHAGGSLAFVAGLGLAAAAVFSAFRGRPGRAAFFIALTVVCMAVVRSVARLGYLAPQFDPAALPEDFQVGPFVFFVASTAAVAAASVWAVAAYRRTAKRG
jgi:hypothetical protein